MTATLTCETDTDAAPRPWNYLTPHELRVVRLAARGLSYQAIADIVGIPRDAVRRDGTTKDRTEALRQTMYSAGKRLAGHYQLAHIDPRRLIVLAVRADQVATDRDLGLTN